jgi:allantoinase
VRPADRLEYSAIVDRPALTPPCGAKVIVWPIVNVEDWQIDRLMPRQVLPPPTGITTIPDVANWAWHEYGMRVGFWRLKALFDSLGIRPTLSINGQVCLSYPRVAEAARTAGWEFMGHGLIQMPTHQVEDQRAMIRQTLETIERFTGKKPLGWLGPGLTQTLETVDHLHAEGIRYIGDWCLDDQPCRVRTHDGGNIVAMPYTLELNDIPVMAIQHHSSNELLRRVTDTLDTLLAEAGDSVRVMAIAVHPFLSGVPHRIRYLKETFEFLSSHKHVAFMTGEEILNWYQQVSPDPMPSTVSQGVRL